VKLLAPESLDEQQRETLRNYSRFFPRGAVCVNVAFGREEWDLRPLLLINGKVHLSRVSSRIDEALLRTVIADLEGFGVIFSSGQRVIEMMGEGRCLLVRPFVSETLQTMLEKGELAGSSARESMVRNLITLVVRLHRRNVAHGHISPSNITLDDEAITLIDPLLGSLNGTQDAFLAPESVAGSVPQASADLFSLGRVIKLLLGESLTDHQRAIVEQLLLASSRHRPPLVEVATAFDCAEINSRQTDPIYGAPGPGRLLKAADTRPVSPIEVPLARQSSRSGTLSGKAPLVVAAVALGFVALKLVSPPTYFSLVRRISNLTDQDSSDFDKEWGSRDPAQIAAVARAAVLEENPAAIEAITQDVIDGSNPKGVRTRLLRVALDQTWNSELRDIDLHAALVVALSELVPEGLKRLPPLADLHPAVIIAIAAETEPTKGNKELKSIPVSKVASLPEPFGPLFKQLSELGYTSLGSPQAIGLAAISTGDTRSKAFEALLSGDSESPQSKGVERTAKLISITLPIVARNPSALSELLAALRAQGGELATRASWFEIEDIAGWSSTNPLDQIKIILGTLPTENLDMTKYVDLLSFPLASIREQSIAVLKQRFFHPSAERLLLALASDANQFSREQSVALVSAIQERDESRKKQFIQKWFELKPNPDTVLLVLLARAHLDTNDYFNWEAAGYLRRNSWKASFEVLKLLATHPIPSARVLAYGRLNPSVSAERDFLKQRLSAEKDPICLKGLMEQLSVLPRE